MSLLIGWITSICIVLSYFWAVKSTRMTVFNWANFIGACILVPMYIAGGLAFGAFLSAFFGMVGLYGIFKELNSSSETQ